jgi:hypothetical protein
MNVKSRIVLPVFLLCLLSSGVYAEESVKESSADSDTLEYTLPEVIVEGDNSMHSLRMEVIHAQELKFEVFNNLNSTDDFDITCGWHVPTGTKIKEWSCEVRFLQKVAADDARDYVDSIIGPAANGPRKPLATREQRAVELARRTRELNREMKALAMKHPELAIAIINAHELEQLYKAEQKKRYGNSIFTGDTKPDLVLNKIVIWEAAFLDHSNGVMPDEIWKRWDSMYRKLFKINTYRRLWKSADQGKYSDEFKKYVNSIISGK